MFRVKSKSPPNAVQFFSVDELRQILKLTVQKANNDICYMTHDVIDMT